MSNVTLRTARENRPFKGSLQLLMINGQGAYVLPEAANTYELRLYRHNNTTAFATATSANGKISIVATAEATTVSYNFPVGDMQGLLGYGSMELISTVVGSVPVVVAPLQFVKADTPYTIEDGQKLTIFDETVVCVVNTDVLQDQLSAVAVNVNMLAPGSPASGSFSGNQLTLNVPGGDAEGAQDAIGAILDSTLVYTDEPTPTLRRAAISGAVVIPAGSNAASLGSFTMAQLNAAISDGDVVDALNIEKGLRALDVFAGKSHLLGRKALVLDYPGGGYAEINESGPPKFLAIEAIPGLTFSNPAGGEVISRKRARSQVGANTLRYTHDVSGSPLGPLFEKANNYLNFRSQPTVAQCQASGNATDASTPAGESGAWIQYPGTAPTTTFSYRNIVSYVAGTDYVISADIVMDDGLAPLIGENVVSGDFLLYVGNSTCALANVKISGPFANNKYTVQGWATAASTISTYFGVNKYPGQSTRSFKVGSVNVSQGRYAPSMFDNTTNAQNSRSADVMAIPLSGFTVQGGFSVYGEYRHPFGAADNYVLDIRQSATNRLYVSTNGASLAMGYYDGVSQYPVGVAVTPGQDCKFAYSLDPITGRIRGKVSGVGAPAEVTTLPKTSTCVPTVANIGNVGGSSNFLGSTIRRLAIADQTWTAAEIAELVG